jgi:hypothetical protein
VGQTSIERTVGMGLGKRKRRRREQAEHPVRAITDDDLDRLLVHVTVRADCAHASTRNTRDGLVLTRCAVDAAVAGGCPIDCPRFDRRRVGGMGLGAGA